MSTENLSAGQVPVAHSTSATSLPGYLDGARFTVALNALCEGAALSEQLARICVRKFDEEVENEFLVLITLARRVAQVCNLGVAALDDECSDPQQLGRGLNGAQL